MNNQDQFFESYVPVYDMVPEKWEDAREFLVEHLKKISNAVNIREIGWFLDQEVLSGKQFIPSNSEDIIFGATQFRTILRKVIDFGALVPGLNTRPHGILFDANFTLIQLWGSATNTTTLIAEPIPFGADLINIDATNINIFVAAAWTRAIAVVEFIQEV